MKKILVVCLSFILLFTLGGWVNYSYGYASLTDGSYFEEYFIDADIVPASEYAIIESAMQTKINNIIDDLNNIYQHILDNYVLKPEQKTELSTAVEITAYENSEEILGFSITFDNYMAYNAFYGRTDEIIEQSRRDHVTIKNNFLTQEIVQQGIVRYGIIRIAEDNPDTIFDESETYDISAELLGAFEDSCGVSITVNDSDVTKTYSIATSSPRIHSDGQKAYLNGYYYHIWSVDNVNDEITIRLWQVEARREIWYVFILGISIFVVIVCAFISIIIKPKNQEGPPQDIEDINMFALKQTINIYKKENTL